jgi:CRP-like cAMP-binding protein
MISTQDLKKIFLLKDLPDSVLGVVAQAAKEVTLAAGDPIGEGDSAHAVILIRTGTVRGTVQGAKTPVLFGAGESFGEVAFLDGGPLGMELQTTERVDAIVLDHKKLAEKLGGNYEAGFLLYRAAARSLAARLRRAVDADTLARDRTGPR